MLLWSNGEDQAPRQVQIPLLSVAEEEHEESAMTPDFFTRTAPVNLHSYIGADKQPRAESRMPRLCNGCPIHCF